MKTVIDATTQNQMGSCKALGSFNMQQATLDRYIQDRQIPSSEAIKATLGVRKNPYEVEDDVSEHHRLVTERKLF